MVVFSQLTCVFLPALFSMNSETLLSNVSPSGLCFIFFNQYKNRFELPLMYGVSFALLWSENQIIGLFAVSLRRPDHTFGQYDDNNTIGMRVAHGPIVAGLFVIYFTVL